MSWGSRLYLARSRGTSRMGDRTRYNHRCGIVRTPWAMRGARRVCPGYAHTLCSGLRTHLLTVPNAPRVREYSALCAAGVRLSPPDVRRTTSGAHLNRCASHPMRVPSSAHLTLCASHPVRVSPSLRLTRCASHPVRVPPGASHPVRVSSGAHLASQCASQCASHPAHIPPGAQLNAAYGICSGRPSCSLSIPATSDFSEPGTR